MTKKNETFERGGQRRNERIKTQIKEKRERRLGRIVKAFEGRKLNEME